MKMTFLNQGVTGDHCEKCDTANHYFGDPITGSCFYDLAIDYQFTFNLSKVPLSLLPVIGSVTFI